MIEQYPKLRELSALSEGTPGSYFHLFWENFDQEPRRVRTFSLLEAELQVLDERAWSFLRDEASGFALCQHPIRGWTQLFERLNEAKGYCYLVKLGCCKPAFIPRAEKEGIETPDLRAMKEDRTILCEVKTINVSDELLECRRGGFVRDVIAQVSPALASKLINTFFKAHGQLTSYKTDSNDKRIVYFVINFDDDLDYRNELNEQVHRVFDDLGCNDIEIVIHSEVAQT